MKEFLRNFSAFAVAALLLGACAATQYPAFVKPGAPVSQVSREQAECDVEANRLFPAAIFTNSFPTGAYGGVRAGYPGYWGYGGSISQTDVNAGMRNQHRVQCMRLKGYEPYVFPVCTQEQLSGRSYAPLTRSPAPGPGICAISLQGGGRALIDLSKPL